MKKLLFLLSAAFLTNNLHGVEQRLWGDKKYLESLLHFNDVPFVIFGILKRVKTQKYFKFAVERSAYNKLELGELKGIAIRINPKKPNFTIKNVTFFDYKSKKLKNVPVHKYCVDRKNKSDKVCKLHIARHLKVKFKAIKRYKQKKRIWKNLIAGSEILKSVDAYLDEDLLPESFLKSSSSYLSNSKKKKETRKRNKKEECIPLIDKNLNFC